MAQPRPPRPTVSHAAEAAPAASASAPPEPPQPPRRTLETAREIEAANGFLASRTIPGQEITLWTYAIPTERDASGTVALIKVIGTFHSEEEAEARAKEELSKSHCKVIRIEPAGEWRRLRDPRVARRSEYDQFNNGEIKRALTSMNLDLEKQEKEDEREMREHEKEVRAEAKQDDSDTLDHFLILGVKIESMPGLIAGYRAEITRLVKEIARLQELEPKQKAEYAALVEKHPDYPERAAAMRASFAKQQ
jgi:hypothetical protein